MRKLYIFFIFIVFFVFSCGNEHKEIDTKDKAECSVDKDCNEGLVCIEGVCENHLGEEGYGCKADDICNEGLVCIEGVCENHLGEEGYGCKSDDICNEGLVCIEGVCENHLGEEGYGCKADDICNEGLVCIEGVCENHLGEEGYGCKADNICNEGLVCIEGVCENHLGEEGYGCKADDICNEGLVCIEGVCENHLGEEGYGCKADNICNEGLVCIEGICKNNLGNLGDNCFDDMTCNNGLTCEENICINENDKLWANLWGTDKWDSGNSVITDNSGNVYVAGRVSGSMDSAVSYGRSDIFISKFDNVGNKLWTKIYGTSFDDFAVDIVSDNLGNIYIAGNTMGNLNGEINSGLNDVFLIKINGEGNLIWTTLLGTIKEENVTSIAIDADNNIFIAGNTKGAFNGINRGNFDIFIAKFDDSGNKLWVKQFGTEAYDGCEDIVINRDNDILITGGVKSSFQNNIYMGNMDLFLSKLDNNGNFIFTKQIGTSQDDKGNALTVDRAGNIFVTGYTMGNLGNYTSFGLSDVILIKFNRRGDKLWVKQWGANDYSSGASLFVNTFNEIVLAANIKIIDNNVNLYKYSEEGEYLWGETLNSNGDDYVSSICEDELGNIFVTGNSKGDLEGNTNSGDSDIFLAKFGVEE